MNVELPAYIGDIVFVYPFGIEKEYIECKITKITINRQGINFKMWKEPYGDVYYCDSKAFGEWVFLEKLMEKYHWNQEDECYDNCFNCANSHLLGGEILCNLKNKIVESNTYCEEYKD